MPTRFATQTYRAIVAALAGTIDADHVVQLPIHRGCASVPVMEYIRLHWRAGYWFPDLPFGRCHRPIAPHRYRVVVTLFSHRHKRQVGGLFPAYPVAIQRLLPEKPALHVRY